MTARKAVRAMTLGAALGWFGFSLAFTQPDLQIPPLPAAPVLQQSEPPSSDPTSPTLSRPWGRWDSVEGAYCLHGKPLETDKNGHECGCKLMCVPAVTDDGQTAVRVEDHACATYCRPQGRSCACHPDVDPADPCGMLLPHEGEPIGPAPTK